MKWLDSITDVYEFEQTPGNRKGQGNLAPCSAWGWIQLGD